MKLHDVTLREGEQRSGQSYSIDQKVRGAELLDSLGVDYIQVGFPVARDGTKAVCARLDIDTPVVGMARAVEGDIDAAVDAGVDVLDVGIPASDLQREHILGLDRDALVDRAIEVYDYAVDTGVEVHLSAMDSFRADPAFLSKLASAVDPPVFTLLDTVGVATPADVVETVDAMDRNPARLGVHFHRDLGVATANVLAAAERGVGRADVTVNGVGDRVGNAALEEVVVAATVGEADVEFGVDRDDLIPTCTDFLEVLGEPIPENKPILGETAFEHESGMHTATMLDVPAVYEGFDPATFGGERRLLFGPSSGRGAARRLLERAGLDDPSDETVQTFLDRLRELDEHVPTDRALDMAREAVEA